MSDDLIERLRGFATKIFTAKIEICDGEFYGNPSANFSRKGKALLTEAADAIAAKDTALSEMRAELERRKEWQDAIIDLCKALGSDDMPWGGDKAGWGFIFYFVKHLHTRATSAEAELERTRKALEAGRQLANVAYNICQQGWPSDVPSFASLREAYETWDEAISAARALAPSIQDEGGER